MKYTLPLLFAALLMGQNCDPQPPPDEPKGLYCDGATEPGALASVGSYVSGSLASIVDGNVSSDRRATVRLQIGNGGWCTGTVIGPHTILSAAHCEGDSYWVVFGYDDGPADRSMGYGLRVFAPYSKKHERYIGWSYQDSRDHDILLIYTDEELPPPYARLYGADDHAACSGLVPQGWGQVGPEHESGACAWHNNCSLRETRNWVAAEGPTWISTRGMPGWICFGDSGGPTYAENADGELVVAAVTSSTSSTDCKLASRLMKTSAFASWVSANKYESKPWE